jgi:cleavage and polyadenylation specificity factor subunit 1
LTVNAAGGNEPTTRRLFVYDDLLKTKFLIDTGADVSILPAREGDRAKVSDYKLYAANGSVIDTYGQRSLNLKLGFRRCFPWRLVVAEVQHAIIGADFLAHYGLLPDLKRKVLINSVTLCQSKCSYRDVKYNTITTIDSSAFSKLLVDFPALTKPTTHQKCKFAHNTEHVIETTGRPLASRARRLTPEKLRVARQTFEELLRRGEVRASKSPWATPLQIVPKKGPEKWRVCGDYRRLNSVTKPDKYPVPNIGDFNTRLSGSRRFTKIDIRRAYNQIPVAKADIEKTAVITPFGLFEYLVMPFGLQNAAQTFQRFLDELFRDLDFVYVYIDDILITSAVESSHAEKVRTVLERLNNAGIVINVAKCQYNCSEVTFLGHTVNAQGILPDPERVEPVMNFPQPNTVKELRRFLGMVNFYRRAIHHAAEYQRRLQNWILSNKKNDNTPLKWTEDAEGAFQQFKTALGRAALLHHPAEDIPLVLNTDASDSAIGGALHQLRGGNLEPLAFFSRKLTLAESKWSTYDRELLAVFAAV